MKRSTVQPSDLRLLNIFVGRRVIDQIQRALDDGLRVEIVETEFGDPGPDYTAIEIAPPQRGVHGKEVCRINGY